MVPVATKIYKKLTNDFTVVSNEILKHNLSLKALGLYLYIINKPDGWNFSRAGVAAQVGDGETSVRSAIEELERTGFLLRQQSRNQDGTLGTFSWVITDRPMEINPINANYERITTTITISDEEKIDAPTSQPLDDYPPAVKPPAVKPPAVKMAQVNTNRVNTKKENTNLSSNENFLTDEVETESFLPGLFPEPSAEPTNTPKLLLEEQAKELVAHFRAVFNRKGGGPKTVLKNLPYWLDEYTLDEIKQAITNAYQDDWWRDKLTLELLLRQRKPGEKGESHEYIDRISKFLATPAKQEFAKLDALTDMDVWQTAKDMNVPWKIVDEKGKNINQMIETGKIHQYARGRNARECLIDWLQIDLNKGRISHCNELEALDIDQMHPRKVAARKKLDEYKKQLIEEGVL